MGGCALMEGTWAATFGRIPLPRSPLAPIGRLMAPGCPMQPHAHLLLRSLWVTSRSYSAASTTCACTWRARLPQTHMCDRHTGAKQQWWCEDTCLRAMRSRTHVPCPCADMGAHLLPLRAPQDAQHALRRGLARQQHPQRLQGHPGEALLPQRGPADAEPAHASQHAQHNVHERADNTQSQGQGGC